MAKESSEGENERPDTRRGRGAKGRARLEDVARSAGVSTASVSRVFSGADNVSKEIATRVRAAARELRWTPNAAGRALASSRTNIAGAIIPTLDNEVFARQVGGLQSVFIKQNITVFLGCSNYDPASGLSHARAMLARGVEALAIVGEDHPPELFQELADRDVPHVITYAYRTSGPFHYVGFDHAAAYCEIVEYLFRLGHRRFAVVFQPMANNSRVQARLAGIRSAISSHGLNLSDDNVCIGSYDIGFGAKSMARLMDRPRKQRPTAIVCGNDTLAIGALAGAADIGLSAPHDFSLTGFDDLSISSLLRPHLTTMSVDNFAIGCLAAEQLLARLKGEAGHSIVVPPTLIVRDTTGAPPD